MSWSRRFGTFAIALAAVVTLSGCASEFTVGAIISESGAFHRPAPKPQVRRAA